MKKVLAFIKSGNSDTIVVSNKVKIMGSVFVIFSGLSLYFYKLHEYFDLSFLVPESFVASNMSGDTYVWLLAQSISPFLLIIGNFFKAYFYSYIVPIYCYMFQMFLILSDYTLVVTDNKYIYSVGLSILIFFGIYLFRSLARNKTRNELKEAKEKIKTLLGGESRF